MYKCFGWAWICKVCSLWHAFSVLISDGLLLRKYKVWNIAVRFMDAIWTQVPIFLIKYIKLNILISVLYIRSLNFSCCRVLQCCEDTNYIPAEGRVFRRVDNSLRSMVCLSTVHKHTARDHASTTLHTYKRADRRKGGKHWSIFKIASLHWRMTCIYYSCLSCFRTTLCVCCTHTTVKIRQHDRNPNSLPSCIMDQHKEDFAVCISWRGSTWRNLLQGIFSSGTWRTLW
jgi:hypothetical protein